MRSRLIHRAHAKVNLSLEILGKRPDGFHEILTIMQTIELHDELEIHPSDTISLDCTDARLNSPDNLVLQAAHRLRSRYKVAAGCAVRLRKRIPVGAGLGGGSSDAARTLCALNELWSIRLSLNELAAIAAEIGSDVPFFLRGGTALVSGRGETVEPLAPPSTSWYTLVNPLVHVPTAQVYGALRSSEWSDGSRTRELAHAIDAGGDARIGVNSLAQPVFRQYPKCEHAFRAVSKFAPRRTLVSGSGPTIAALCESREQAVLIAEQFQGDRWWTAATRSVDD